MSWHTPALAVHASDAGVCTVVTPGMYSISSRSAEATASAASAGSSSDATRCASSTTSAGGAVVRVSERNSASRSRSSAPRRVSQVAGDRSGGRSATSTRCSAVITIDSWGVSTSNAETAVPQ